MRSKVTKRAQWSWQSHANSTGGGWLGPHAVAVEAGGWWWWGVPPTPETVRPRCSGYCMGLHYTLLQDTPSSCRGPSAALQLYLILLLLGHLLRKEKLRSNLKFQYHTSMIIYATFVRRNFGHTGLWNFSGDDPRKNSLGQSQVVMQLNVRFSGGRSGFTAFTESSWHFLTSPY